MIHLISCFLLPITSFSLSIQWSRIDFWTSDGKLLNAPRLEMSIRECSCLHLVREHFDMVKACWDGWILSIKIPSQILINGTLFNTIIFLPESGSSPLVIQFIVVQKSKIMQGIKQSSRILSRTHGIKEMLSIWACKMAIL